MRPLTSRPLSPNNTHMSNTNFHHRFTPRSPSSPDFGLVFRVVDPNPKEMILWSEVNAENEDQDGSCWSGPLAIFKGMFILIK